MRLPIPCAEFRNGGINTIENNGDRVLRESLVDLVGQKDDMFNFIRWKEIYEMLEETTDRIVVVGGFKWNVSGTWLLTANVLRPITDVGLNASWVPTVTFDYSFGG